jgi:hypothetical protein
MSWEYKFTTALLTVEFMRPQLIYGPTVCRLRTLCGASIMGRNFVPCINLSPSVFYRDLLLVHAQSQWPCTSTTPYCQQMLDPIYKYICQDFLTPSYVIIGMLTWSWFAFFVNLTCKVCLGRALSRHLIRYITKPTPNGKRNVSPSGKSQKIKITKIWQPQWPTYNTSRPSVFTYGLKLIQPVHLNTESRKK